MELTPLFLIGFLSLLIGSFAYSGVTLPRVFGSNMVMQRGQAGTYLGMGTPKRRDYHNTQC